MCNIFWIGKHCECRLWLTLTNHKFQQLLKFHKHPSQEGSPLIVKGFFLDLLPNPNVKYIWGSIKTQNKKLCWYIFSLIFFAFAYFEKSDLFLFLPLLLHHQLQWHLLIQLVQPDQLFLWWPWWPTWRWWWWPWWWWQFWDTWERKQRPCWDGWQCLHQWNLQERWLLSGIWKKCHTEMMIMRRTMIFSQPVGHLVYKED